MMKDILYRMKYFKRAKQMTVCSFTCGYNKKICIKHYSSLISKKYFIYFAFRKVPTLKYRIVLLSFVL